MDLKERIKQNVEIEDYGRVDEKLRDEIQKLVTQERADFLEKHPTRAQSLVKKVLPPSFLDNTMTFCKKWESTITRFQFGTSPKPCIEKWNRMVNWK